MKSSKAEVVARSIWIDGLVVFMVSLTGLQLFGSRLNDVVIDELCMVTALIGVGFGVLGAIAQVKVAHKRLAASVGSRRETLENTSGIPDMSLCDTSEAILTLYWNINFQKYLKLNASFYLLTTGVYISSLLLLAILAPIAYFALHINRPAELVVAATATLVGVAVTLILTAEDMREYYPNETPNRTTVLTVGPSGINQIAGKVLTTILWPDLNICRQIPGVVIMERKGLSFMVPADAFHKPEDRMAFIDTLNAMKDGKLPPKYDWSAYRPVNFSAEGSWPPPISLSETQ